ncbi:MAG TPA: hypothetical protein VFD30_11835 [Terriglobia bacterium]|nr:hypothetical protein [Terriglobia bacterium]
MSFGGEPCAGREVVDRVVASLGSQAITESDVRAAYEFELFLEGRNPNAAPDPETARRVLDQLIEQRLLLRESETEKWDHPELRSAAEARLESIRRKFQSEAAFDSALRAMRLDQAQVLTRLEDQERILRLIDRRFRPGAWVDESEIEAYYRENFAPEYTRRSGQPAPPLAEVEAQIREILVQKKIDQLLNDWLTDLKGSHVVKLHEF